MESFTYLTYSSLVTTAIDYLPATIEEVETDAPTNENRQSTAVYRDDNIKDKKTQEEPTFIFDLLEYKKNMDYLIYEVEKHTRRFEDFGKRIQTDIAKLEKVVMYLNDKINLVHEENMELRDMLLNVGKKVSSDRRIKVRET